MQDAVRKGLPKSISVSSRSVGYLYSCLQDCIRRKNLALGKEVYSLVRKSSLESNAFLASHLIRMFALCGSLQDAAEVFQGLTDPTVFSWGAIISAHGSLRQNNQVISLYHEMCHSGVTPDGHVFVAVLKACADAAFLIEGRRVHADAIRSCFELNVFITNILVDMYCKCGILEDAEVVFNTSMEQTLVTWSTLSSGYVQHGQPHRALRIFEKVYSKDFQLDSTIFISTLQACSRLYNIIYGKSIHFLIVETGCDNDLRIVSTLVDMYAKCGHLMCARSMFKKTPKRDVIMWNALIGGYVENEEYEHVVTLFTSMQEECVEPDQVTFASLLKGPSTPESLDQGKILHTVIVHEGFETSSIVGSSLIDMYIKCGSTEDAYGVFDKLHTRDVVTWSTMIAGFVHDGHAYDAVKLSQKMRLARLQPNPATFSCILKACSSIAAFKEGKLVHADVMKGGCESDVFVASALIDMFAKCGSLEDACRLFDRSQVRDVVVWNAIIAGFAEHSDFASALEYYEHMSREGSKPDDATFASLLAACSHLGVVAEGCDHFNALRTDHGIEPTLDHYNSMVDLFGRVGHLNEAADVLHIMPFQDNFVGWTTLLSHCRTHGDSGHGNQSFGNAFSIDQSSSPVYVLMSHIYAHSGLWEFVDKLEGVRLSATAWKKPGQAFLEIDYEIYNFVVGDKDRQESGEMCAKLHRLRKYMEDEGYNPLADLARYTTADNAVACE